MSVIIISVMDHEEIRAHPKAQRVTERIRPYPPPQQKQTWKRAMNSVVRLLSHMLAIYA
ncbi:hypothetical protein HJFPF1_09858 [Paramyrothecium foliicola]|nr:hypothetical protein HJFPF1_09858 [Paramyrothecium foliicola]